jgi:hypothetical protein
LKDRTEMLTATWPHLRTDFLGSCEPTIWVFELWTQSLTRSALTRSGACARQPRRDALPRTREPSGTGDWLSYSSSLPSSLASSSLTLTILVGREQLGRASRTTWARVANNSGARKVAVRRARHGWYMSLSVDIGGAPGRVRRRADVPVPAAYAVFDCETTGTTPGLDEIVSLAVVRLDVDGLEQAGSRTWSASRVRSRPMRRQCTAPATWTLPRRRSSPRLPSSCASCSPAPCSSLTTVAST